MAGESIRTDPRNHAAEGDEPVGVQIIRQLERAIAVIRAEHAQKAAMGGSPCICEWCRDA